ncbi:MAG: hypothetical protein VST68_04825 [Nitrospirota bacterium]|nr:hypothetical protein [Nitrospirota bacterium]
MKWNRKSFVVICAGLIVPFLSVFISFELLPGDMFINHAKKFSETMNDLKNAKSSEDRFYILGKAAKVAFSVGEYDKARIYALELIDQSSQFKGNWNHGNAIHDGNMVLGRLALFDGNLEKAKKHLFESGKTPGSPQLNSFGPNMSLARDLVKEGEEKVVLEYFYLCRQFWKLDFGKLSRWTFYIQVGITPGFGVNLVY